MSEFSAGDAGLIGFKLTRQHPDALISWSILAFAVSLVSSLLLAQFAGPLLAEMATVKPFEPLGEAEALDRMRKFASAWPALVVLIPIGLVVSGVLGASINRIVLTPQDKGFGYLQFGQVELRQILVMLLQTLIQAVVMFGGMVAVAVVGGLLSLASAGLGALVMVLGFVAVFCAYIYVAVRLSLLGSVAFDTGKIDLAATWAMSERRFWPMLGAYVIAFVMGFIVNMLGSAIFMGVAGIAFGASQPIPTSIAAVFAPLSLVYLLFNAVFTTLFQLILLAAGPSIYQQLQGRVTAFD